MFPNWEVKSAVISVDLNLFIMRRCGSWRSRNSKQRFLYQAFWYLYLIPSGGRRGGGGEGGVRPAISKMIASMSVRFCRVLETSLNVLEMLKLCSLAYHNNSSK